MPAEPAAEHVQAAVADRGGAVVIAPVGGGKTTVARAASERLGGAVWVTGTVSDRVIPFAAVRDLIDVPDDSKTAAVLRAARESVADGVRCG